jgi:hypothetical protein
VNLFSVRALRRGGGRRTEMDAYLIDRLNTQSSRLHDLASAQQSPIVEMAEVISALGLALEALRVLGEEVNDIKAGRLNLNPDT